MDVIEFHKYFLEQVKITAITDGEGSNSAFVSEFAKNLLEAEILNNFTPAFYNSTGKNNRKIRVDGYDFDEYDFTLSLIISDYLGDEMRPTITKTQVSTIFDRLLYFLEEALEGSLYRTLEVSTPVYDLYEELRKRRNQIRKYRFILITDGFMSNRITEIESREFQKIPIDCQIWDIDRLYRICFAESGRQDIMIDFLSYTDNQGIPCIEASNVNNEEYKSYLCIIPGNALANIYDYYGSQLLEGNVRSFLSTKVAVNKKIRETILNIPQNFFAYNNGISATAMNIKFKETKNGKVITFASNFQIINGGQTTASLSNARYRDKADLSQVFVQMKLTEVDSNAERSNELIRNISRSSNNQNKVSDADFFATHPFHIRMEQISRKTFSPATGGFQYETKWFYERARGQYLQKQMRMTKSEKEKFALQNPKRQMITKTDLAKFRNSWREQPHIVSRGAQANFINFANLIDRNWEKSDTQFNEKYFKDSVALAILFKQTETLVSRQSWFEQGYRANIVTYSIALLHFLISEQFQKLELDLQLIWNRQQIPDIILNELGKITKSVFLTITDSKRETINVTQWCKKEECWEQVKKSKITLSGDFIKVLISQEEEKKIIRGANKDQKLVSDIEAQTQVFEMGAIFWSNMEEFAINKKMNISEEHLKAMKYAKRIPSQYPSPYQSLLLLSLLDEAKKNGFKFKGE